MRYFSKKIIKNLKEAMENDDEFKKSLAEDKETCVLCGKHINGHGNNPAPLADEGKCCDACNKTKVIPARMKFLIDKKRVDKNYDDEPYETPFYGIEVEDEEFEYDDDPNMDY